MHCSLPHQEVSPSSSGQITAVADCSFLTDFLVLSLAAALCWPGSPRCASSSAAEGTGVGRPASAIQTGIHGRSGPGKPLAKHDSAARRGVLDDDPAILADSSEDCCEGLTAFAVLAGNGLNCRTSPLATHEADLIFPSAPRPATLIDLLCSYQC